MNKIQRRVFAGSLILYVIGVTSALTFHHNNISVYIIAMSFILAISSNYKNIHISKALSKKQHLENSLKDEIDNFLDIFADMNIDSYQTEKLIESVQKNFIDEDDLEEAIGFYHDFYGNYERMNIIIDFIESPNKSFISIINDAHEMNIKMNNLLKNKVAY